MILEARGEKEQRLPAQVLVNLEGCGERGSLRGPYSS